MATPNSPASGGGSGSTIKGSGSSSSSRDGTAKAMVADQISEAVQSTANLLHLMQQSSPSQIQLMKLPKNFLAKASTIKNTGQVLEQMPQVISSLDAHMDNGLQSIPHLETVSQLLTNMESCQLSSFSQAHPQPQKKGFHSVIIQEPELANQPPKLE